jgi:hypothetical protein
MMTGDHGKSRKIWQRHERRIAGIITKRKMVSLNEIAKWCARKDGRIEPDQGVIQYTYDELYNSIVSGEFDQKNGRCSVVSFNRHYPYLRLHRRHAIEWGLFRDQLRDQFSRKFLEKCFLPHELCTAWLAKRRQQPNPGWTMATPEAERGLRQAAAADIRKALRAVYDEAKANGAPPPNVKAVRPLAQALLVQRGLTASENHIGNIADEEEFSRRRRPGKTLKSERRTAPV